MENAYGFSTAPRSSRAHTRDSKNEKTIYGQPKEKRFCDCASRSRARTPPDNSRLGGYDGFVPPTVCTRDTRVNFQSDVGFCFIFLCTSFSEFLFYFFVGFARAAHRFRLICQSAGRSVLSRHHTHARTRLDGAAARWSSSVRHGPKKFVGFFCFWTDTAMPEYGEITRSFGKFFTQFRTFVRDSFERTRYCGGRFAVTNFFNFPTK